MRAFCLLLVLLSLPAFALSDLDQGRKLLSRYGWTCESNTVEMIYTVPSTLTGHPELFYQSASRGIGLDLTPVAGKEVRLVRYTLSRRSHGSNAHLFGHVVFRGSTIVGAWLSTDAPIAPGIVALDQEEFGLDF